MDLTLSPYEQAFRDELRGWLAENHPGEEPTGDEAGFEFRVGWQKKLHEAGYAGVSFCPVSSVRARGPDALAQRAGLPR